MCNGLLPKLDIDFQKSASRSNAKRKASRLAYNRESGTDFSRRLIVDFDIPILTHAC